MSVTKAEWELQAEAAWRQFRSAIPAPARTVREREAYIAGYLAATESRSLAVPGVVTRGHTCAFENSCPACADMMARWEAEARGRAQAAPPADRTYEAGWNDGHLARDAELKTEAPPADEVAGLLKDVATVRFFVGVTVAGGAHPSGAPQALDRLEQHLKARL